MSHDPSGLCETIWKVSRYDSGNRFKKTFETMHKHHRYKHIIFTSMTKIKRSKPSHRFNIKTIINLLVNLMENLNFQIFSGDDTTLDYR